MDCPSCGRANASDHVECSYCEALLVDVFRPPDEKTDPMLSILGAPSPQREDGGDSGSGFTRPPFATQYTGDLPRLFRFGNRYQILEKLGEGGMGRVYKALDLELDRAVALKTIRAEKGTGAEVLKRFKQELVLARKITHKNVVRIYDLGESEGMKFFTMELVEGQSLRDVLREKKTVSAKEAISLMKQMLSGLAEAHAQGIVHRDLKPQNIMIDRDEVLRIMDFGIARAADTQTLTGSSEMMGTPDYISPEQVKGDTATAQSDLYAVGVILYELLTGEVPFKGDTAISKVVARLQVKPALPRSLNPEIPGYLERIILKLMEVDPDLRYKTAQEVLQDLEREQVDSSFFLRTRKSLARRRGQIVAACLVGAAFVGVWYYRKLPEGAASADVNVTTLAILPFHNTTGNPELQWMENGIPEMLITDISQSRSLRPVLAERIDRILQGLGKAGQSRLDEQTIELVSETAGAEYSLHGRFVESQGRLRMDLVLRESGTGVGSPIKIDGASSEIFALVDDLTRRVTEGLNLDSHGETNRPLAEVSTKSLAAFRAYHQARIELQRGANQAAVPFLQEAIRQDPRFAMAHARLAETYFHLGDQANALASITTAKALAEESPLPLAERYQVHAIAARIQDDPETAVASYRELAKLFPTDPDILNGLASSLETLGSVGESMEVYRNVLTLSPGHGAALLGLGRTMVTSGHPNEAAPLLRETIDKGLFENDAAALGMIHSILGVAYRDMARYEEAIHELESSLAYRRKAEDMRGIATSLSNLAAALRRVGRFEEARKHLNEALSIAREMDDKTAESLALLNLGSVEADSGDLDGALEHYRRALDIEWERNEHTELAIRLNSIAEILRRRGFLSDALVYLELSKQHQEHSEDLIEKAYNLRIRGRIEGARGDYQSAQAALLEALQLCQKVGERRNGAQTQLLLSELYTGQGRFTEALQAVDSAERLLENGADERSPEVHLVRAEIYVQLGAAQRASEELSLAERTLDALPHSERLTVKLLRAKLRRTDDAARELEKLVRTADQSRLLEQAIRARITLGSVNLISGKREEAVRILEEARELSAELRLRPLQAESAFALAEAFLTDGKLEEARQYASEVVESAKRFEGRLLIARGNHLLGKIARGNGFVDDAEKFESEAHRLAAAILAQTPPELSRSFLDAHPWVRLPLSGTAAKATAHD